MHDQEILIQVLSEKLEKENDTLEKFHDKEDLEMTTFILLHGKTYRL